MWMLPSRRGLVRDGGEGQLSDELVGQVVAAVRPARPQGHGAAWEALEAQRERIVEWVGKRRLTPPRREIAMLAETIRWSHPRGK